MFPSFSRKGLEKPSDVKHGINASEQLDFEKV